MSSSLSFKSWFSYAIYVLNIHTVWTKHWWCQTFPLICDECVFGVMLCRGWVNCVFEHGLTPWRPILNHLFEESKFAGVIYICYEKKKTCSRLIAGCRKSSDKWHFRQLSLPSTSYWVLWLRKKKEEEVTFQKSNTASEFSTVKRLSFRSEQRSALRREENKYC